MTSYLHLVVVFEILWLISGAISHHSQSTSKDKSVENKRTDVEDGDFYFEKQKIQADNVVIGRPIHLTAWSEEDKEHENPQPLDEGKDRPQSDREWSLVNLLKYVLSLVYEFVDEDTFPNKEIPPDINNTELKNAILASELIKENDNRNEKNNINERSNDVSRNLEDDRSQQLKSNYLTNYHLSEDIKWIDSELSEEYEEYSSGSEGEYDIFSNERTFYRSEDSNFESDEKAFRETDTDSDGSKFNANKKNSMDDTKRNRNKVDCSKIKENGRHSLDLKKKQTKVNPNGKSQEAVDDVSKFRGTKPEMNDDDVAHPRKKAAANEQHNSTKTTNQEDRSIEKNSQANSFENCEEEKTETPVNNVIQEKGTVILNESHSRETSKKTNGSAAVYIRTTSPSTPEKTSKSTYSSELDNSYETQAETPLMSNINTQNLEEGTINDENMKSETASIAPKYTSRQTKIVSTSYSEDGRVTNITPQGTSRQEITSDLRFKDPSKTTHTSSNSVFTHTSALSDSHFQGDLTETTDLPLNTVQAYTTEVYNKNSPRSYSNMKRKEKSSQTSNTYGSTPLVSEFIQRSDILNQVPYTFNTKNEEIDGKAVDGLNNTTESSRDSATPEKSEDENSKPQHTGRSPELRKSSENEQADSSPESRKPSKEEHSEPQDTGSSPENRKPLEDEHSKPQDTDRSSESSKSSEDDNYMASNEETEVENDDSTQNESSYSDLEISDHELQNQNYEEQNYKSENTLSGKDLSDIDGQEENIQDEDIIRRQSEGTKNANEQKNKNMTTILMTSSPQLLQRTDVEKDEESKEQFGTILEYLYKHSNSPFILSIKTEANQSSDNE